MSLRPHTVQWPKEIRLSHSPLQAKQIEKNNKHLFLKLSKIHKRNARKPLKARQSDQPDDPSQ